MFHIKYHLDKSSIHGIGIFADEDISEGSIVYSINDALDLIVSASDFSNLSDDERHTISHFGYLDRSSDHWHLSFDDIRFCNHSPDSNIVLKGSSLVAKKDISCGEELTQDYSEFEVLRDCLRNQ